MWVCNHTSMIDYIILTAYSPFAVIMQLHPGWVRPPHCIFFTSRAASLKSAHRTESPPIVQSCTVVQSSWSSPCFSCVIFDVFHLQFSCTEDYKPRCMLRECRVEVQIQKTNRCCGAQVGFLQTQVLGCLGCLWFNRNEVRMRSFARTSQRISPICLCDRTSNAPLILQCSRSLPASTCEALVCGASHLMSEYP